MNINKLMKEAQKMQEKLQEEMSTMRVDGSAGGGMVKVTVNGNKELISISIDPEIIKPEEKEMLQDLIIAAYSSASSTVEGELKNKLGGLLPGMPMPF